MRRLFLSALLLTAALGGAAVAADQPGQKFLVRPADLPKPYATPSATNNDVSIFRPAGVMPEAPKGFTVSIFADGLSNARGLIVAPNGDVFLSERNAGKITLLRDGKGAGKADQRFTFVSGFVKFRPVRAFYAAHIMTGGQGLCAELARNA